jgi:hypothetical protein
MFWYERNPVFSRIPEIIESKNWAAAHFRTTSIISFAAALRDGVTL